MRIRPIKTKTDYEKALARVDTLMDAKRGTLKGKELDALVTLIEAYENKHFPMTTRTWGRKSWRPVRHGEIPHARRVANA